VLKKLFISSKVHVQNVIVQNMTRPFFFLTTKTRGHEFFLSPFAKGGRLRGGLVEQCRDHNIQRNCQILATSNILNTEGTEDTELFVSVPSVRSVLKKLFISSKMHVQNVIVQNMMRPFFFLTTKTPGHQDIYIKEKLRALVSSWLKKHPHHSKISVLLSGCEGSSYIDKLKILRFAQNDNFQNDNLLCPAVAGMVQRGKRHYA
jgi:hypothetical protein